MNSNPKIIFMGTPEFAVPTLKALNEKYGVDTVVTVPDKAQGRGRKLAPSPVKEYALEQKIPVLTPDSLKDPEFEKVIIDIDADIIVVLAFKILPEGIFTRSKLGTFNIHGSLLPKFRGAAPINWAIIKGEKETGLTSFLLRQKVDTGDILLNKRIDIVKGMTAGDLHDALMPLAAELSIETVELLMSGEYEASKQDNNMATPAPKLFRENCVIDWHTPAVDLMNFIHGTSPIPASWTNWKGKRLKIFRVNIEESLNKDSGYFVIENNNLFVQCGDKALRLTEIQLQGKGKMKTSDFLLGYRGETEGRFK